MPTFLTSIAPASSVTPAGAGVVPNGISPNNTQNQDFYMFGFGAALGQWADARTFKFSANGHFYTLEGCVDRSTSAGAGASGNHRVQRFSGADSTLGQPLSAYSLGAGTGGGAAVCNSSQDPYDLAIDENGVMWVSYSAISQEYYEGAARQYPNMILRIAPDGTRQKITFPGSEVLDGGFGHITTWRTPQGVEKIAVIARKSVSKIYLLNLDGSHFHTVSLDRTIPQDQKNGLVAGGNVGLVNGDFYVQAGDTNGNWPSHLLRFGFDGVLRETIGIAEGRPNINETAAGFLFGYGTCLDAQNRLYALDRNTLCRFDAPTQTGARGRVILAAGKMTDDPAFWNEAPGFLNPATIPAVHPTSGRTFVMAVTTHHAGQGGGRERPFILRVPTTFFTPGTYLGTAAAYSYKALKTQCSISSSRYAFTQHSLDPFPFRLHLSTPVNSVVAAWKAVDARGVKVAGGVVTMPLAPSGQNFSGTLDLSFTPPHYSAYTIQCRFLDEEFRTTEDEDYNSSAPDGELGENGYDGVLVKTTALHVAIARTLPGTSQFKAMPTLVNPAPGTQYTKVDDLGGTKDPLFSAWAGLQLIRIGSRQDVVGFVTGCVEHGVDFMLEFDSIANDLGSSYIAGVAAQVKSVTGWASRLKAIQLVNEPNEQPNGAIRSSPTILPLSSNPQFVELMDKVKLAYPQLKTLLPGVPVLCPNLVKTDLLWLDDWFFNGMGEYMDAIGHHFYDEGQSVDPHHRKRAYAAIRGVCAKYGYDFAIWQTERGYEVYKDGVYEGIRQASEILLHFDQGEEEGTPDEHNYLYFISDRGFIPFYLLRANGWLVAALMTREREANLGGGSYESKLRFGHTGDEFFWGHLHRKATGNSVARLSTLQAGAPSPSFTIIGASGNLTLCDSFGNLSNVPVVGGKITLTLDSIPVYLHLPVGASIVPDKLNYGPNVLKGFLNNQNNYAVATPPTWTGGAGITPYSFRGGRGGQSTALPGEAGNAAMSRLFFPDLYTYGPDIQNQLLTLTFDEITTVGSLAWFGQPPNNDHCAIRDFDVEVFAGGSWVTAAQVRGHFPATDRVRLHEPGVYHSVSAVGYGDNTGSYLVPLDDFYEAEALRVRVFHTTRGKNEDRAAFDAALLQWGGAPGAILDLAGIKIFPSNVPIPISLASVQTDISGNFSILEFDVPLETLPALSELSFSPALPLQSLVLLPDGTVRANHARIFKNEVYTLSFSPGSTDYTETQNLSVQNESRTKRYLAAYNDYQSYVEQLEPVLWIRGHAASYAQWTDEGELGSDAVPSPSANIELFGDGPLLNQATGSWRNNDGNSWVSVGQCSEIRIQRDFAFQCWVKMPASNQGNVNGCLFGIGPFSPTVRFYENHSVFNKHNHSQLVPAAAPLPKDGNWYLISVAVSESGLASIYINGALSGSAQANPTFYDHPESNLLPVVIGSNIRTIGNNVPTDLRLDAAHYQLRTSEFCFFSPSPTAAQFAEMYAQSQNPTPSVANLSSVEVDASGLFTTVAFTQPLSSAGAASDFVFTPALAISGVSLQDGAIRIAHAKVYQNQAYTLSGNGAGYSAFQAEVVENLSTQTLPSASVLRPRRILARGRLLSGRGLSRAR